MAQAIVEEMSSPSSTAMVCKKRELVVLVQSGSPVFFGGGPFLAEKVVGSVAVAVGAFKRDDEVTALAAPLTTKV